MIENRWILKYKSVCPTFRYVASLLIFSGPRQSFSHKITKFFPKLQEQIWNVGSRSLLGFSIINKNLLEKYQRFAVLGNIGHESSLKIRIELANILLKGFFYFFSKLSQPRFKICSQEIPQGSNICQAVDPLLCFVSVLLFFAGIFFGVDCLQDNLAQFFAGDPLDYIFSAGNENFFRLKNSQTREIKF